ncbi:MAG: hypothetical protein S0880_36630 [Actinomycetota bacterium]|nr:hypothetical protein [Actinomycetota bacterium]
MVQDRDLGDGRAQRAGRHAEVASALALLSDHRLRDLVEDAPVLGSGIGGTRALVHVEGTPVFVKRVPLTDLERRPDNVMSTANVFDLPLGCQYGVGSPSFGVWRELAANALTTSWVLAGRSVSFPLMYHWRVLDGPASDGPLSDELADADEAASHWNGSVAVRRRVEAIGESSATVTLFLEHLPHALPDWLDDRMAEGAEAFDAAVAMVERCLRRDVALMNRSGLFHFDAHFANILTDGRRLYLADFGLASSPRFELTSAEADFLEANRSHDACHSITRLVDWLVTALTDVADGRAHNELIADIADGAEPVGMSGTAAAIVRRYAPVAVVVNEFYRRLHTEDRSAPYPAEQVERACATSGFGTPWWAG